MTGEQSEQIIEKMYSVLKSTECLLLIILRHSTIRSLYICHFVIIVKNVCKSLQKIFVTISKIADLQDLSLYLLLFNSLKHENNGFKAALNGLSLSELVDWLYEQYFYDKKTIDYHLTTDGFLLQCPFSIIKMLHISEGQSEGEGVARCFRSSRIKG